MASESFEPLQLTRQFRQVLSADKLTVGFFLGAGCPCSVRVADGTDGSTRPLIPDIRGLTLAIDKKLKASAHAGTYKTLVDAMKEDSESEPNIETMLNRIRALRIVAGSSDVRGLTGDELKTLDEQISAQIKSEVAQNLPFIENGYCALAGFIRQRRRPHVELFTTNYDTLIEQGLERRQVRYFDGFVGAVRPFFDHDAIESNDMPPSWSRLWKLHGSINWRYVADSKLVVRSEADGDELMIHPSHMKYDESRRMPYFVMIDRLKAFLKRREKPAAFFILGYSFGDQHLNEAIIDSLRANPQSACFALQFGKLADYKDGVELARRTPNLTLVAKDGGIVRGVEGQWLADAATDLAELTHMFESSAPPAPPGAGADADDDKAKPCVFVAGDFKRFGEFLNGLAPYLPETVTT
jgi:hypothetical protein